MQQRPQKREFQRLLAAEGISNFGAMLSRLAIPWLAALVLQASPWQMAMLLVADVVAAAAGALLLGAWVERHGKRQVMLWCDGARALVLLALAGLAWRGEATMPLLAGAAAANGVLTMAFEVARSAWMAQRPESGELVRRNAQMSVATSLSETAAFALGGWLFQWLGAVVALLVDALSYVASAVCLRGVPDVCTAVRPKDTAKDGAQNGAQNAAHGAEGARVMRIAAAGRAWRQELAEGLVAVAAHPTLRALAVIEGLLAVAGSLAGTSYMIYVARDLAIPTGPLGVIFALGGLGAIIGARLAERTAHRFGVGRAMTVGLVAVALGAACIPLATGAGPLAIGLLVMHQLVGDGGHTVFAVHDRTLRQTEVQPQMLARADSGIRGLGQCATLVGALLGGVVGSALGARGVLWLCAGVLLLAAAYAAARLRR
ncbi:MAG: MFS transporter [Rubrivivax sp.]|nr:MFS transporter [Rubrivivax sp.]